MCVRSQSKLGFFCQSYAVLKIVRALLETGIIRSSCHPGFIVCPLPRSGLHPEMSTIKPACSWEQGSESVYHWCWCELCSGGTCINTDICMWYLALHKKASTQNISATKLGTDRGERLSSDNLINSVLCQIHRWSTVYIFISVIYYVKT